ncbi:hypothetical protein PPL_09960 [Heterostelium album PN500]|uniref:Ankyrin repeat protein n=1 Tax=Heterostelium pallidum (strain ATCC 26659 / Pp 5 / PN500) TaxID=670386 RepID=D3BPN5_HETP5|nr:hypothetical protein PPL_09960 [Heterostelium album PN500]EFA76655.1 hypothetical protein PPL_09960 [Heterostelium album PN500]|eukprot:XP_020428787.1 hypothetical protein PPL_09960 [Heterostelium album PN500]
MDKRLFSLVLNNKVLFRIIFNHVSLISSLKGGNGNFKWSEVIVNPHILASHNYFEEMKQCLSIRNDIDYRYYRKRLTMEMAIKYGSIEMFIFLLNRLKVDMNTTGSVSDNSSGNHLNSIFICAAQSGRFDIIEYLTVRFETYQWNYYLAMERSPLSGNFELLKYLVKMYKNNRMLNNELKQGETVFDRAAWVGRIDMIEFLVQETPQFLKSSSMYENAISAGHLHAVEYLLREHRSLANIKTYLIFFKRPLKEKDNFDIIKLLINNNIEINIMELVDHEVASGNLELLQWLKNHSRLEYSSLALENEAYYGHLESLKWLYNNFTGECSGRVMDLAAHQGHFEIVIWINENRTEGCTDNIMSEVILGCGRLDILEYLYDNQPISYSNLNDNDFMLEAAALGRLDILQYFHSKNIPCQYLAMDYAAANNHQKVVRWLYENGIIQEFQESSLVTASSRGNIEIVKYIIQNSTRLSLENAICNAIKSNHLDVVKYLFSLSTQDTITKRNYFVISTTCENTDVLKWLHSNIDICCTITEESFYLAIKNTNLPLAKWIFSNIGEDRKNLFKMETFSSDLFKFNQYEIIEWILESFRGIPRSELESYKQILETKYSNSKESIEIINKYLLN